MKRSNKVISVISSLSFLVSLLLGIIFICSFSHSFYEYEYHKNNQADMIGMSEEDLMKSTDTLLDYLNNKRDDIVVEANVNGNVREVFNERETLHMIDVKNLCNNAKLSAVFMFLLSLCGFIYLFIKEKKYSVTLISYGIKYAIILLVIFVGLLGIYAVADFYDFWMNFHYLFFDNDLFILDPNTSIMINMFPESFFFDLVILIMIIYVAIIVSFLWVTNVLKKRMMHD